MDPTAFVFGNDILTVPRISLLINSLYHRISQIVTDILDDLKAFYENHRELFYVTLLMGLEIILYGSCLNCFFHFFYFFVSEHLKITLSLSGG